VQWKLQLPTWRLNDLGGIDPITPGGDLDHPVVLQSRRERSPAGSSPVRCRHAAAEGDVTVSAQRTATTRNQVFTTQSSTTSGHIGEYSVGGCERAQYTVTLHKRVHRHDDTCGDQQRQRGVNINGTIAANQAATTDHGRIGGHEKPLGPRGRS